MNDVGAPRGRVGMHNGGTWKISAEALRGMRQTERHGALWTSDISEWWSIGHNIRHKRMRERN